MARQKTPGFERAVQPLVRVNRDRVRQSKSLEVGARVVERDGRRSVRSVYVKPEIELLADPGDLGERVDCAGTDRSSCTNYHEGVKTGGAILRDSLAQIIGSHAAVIVGRDPANRGSAQSTHIGGLVDPGVHFTRAVKHQTAALRISESFRANVPWRLRFSRGDEAHDVGHIAAAHQHSIPLAWQSKELGEPADGFVLDLCGDWREGPRAAVWIDGRREKIRECTNRRRR